jgi:prevent-host-death family protein
MDKIIPISDLQSKAKKYVDQVKKTSEPVVITQRGRAAAVLVNYEEFEGLVATQREMSFADWGKRLERAKHESGKGMSLESYLKRRKTKS